MWNKKFCLCDPPAGGDAISNHGDWGSPQASRHKCHDSFAMTVLRQEWFIRIKKPFKGRIISCTKVPWLHHKKPLKGYSRRKGL